MDSAPEAPANGARSSPAPGPASPLTPKRIIRRLAVPKSSPSLELEPLLDTQQADSCVEAVESSTSQLAPAIILNASAAHKVTNKASTSQNSTGYGLADVSHRQAITPLKRQNQSSPEGRPKGKAGRSGKGGGREAFAAVKKLAGSLAKRASLCETENGESSGDGVAPETRDGQKRISAYFTPFPKKGSSQGEELGSPGKGKEERMIPLAEGQVAAVQGGQVAPSEGGQVAAGELPTAETVVNGVDSLESGNHGAGVCEQRRAQEPGDVTIASGQVPFEKGGSFSAVVDTKNAGGEGQEAGTVPLGGLSQGAHEPPRTHQATGMGLRLSRELQHCSNERESRTGLLCEGTSGPASCVVTEGSLVPGATEASVSTAMDTEVPAVGSTGVTLIGTGELDPPMLEEMIVETMVARLHKAPISTTASEGNAADPFGSAPEESPPSELLVSKPLSVGSRSPAQEPAKLFVDNTQGNRSLRKTDILTKPEVDTSAPLSDSTLVSSSSQKPIPEITGAPVTIGSNLRSTSEEAPDSQKPAELTLDAIDEMCAALLADIEDLPTTVPFLGGSPKPSRKAHEAGRNPVNPSETFPNDMDPKSVGSNPKVEATVLEGVVEQIVLVEPLENTPNQLEVTSLAAFPSPLVEVLVTERTDEQTVDTEPSTSEAELAEAQWRRKLGERRRRGRMAVTDLCALEWCEMQVDFGTRVGKPAPTPVMQAGTARHEQLEREVITRVEVPVATREDAWALKLLNMITGLRQLATEGMTRELYILGCLEGHWIVGIIDELRLVERGGAPRTLLCDTKTRRTLKPPSDAQKRTGMLQLMCYKLLFDGLLSAAPFPADAFFGHFALNARAPLSADVTEHAAAECALHVATLEEAMDGLAAECRDTAPAHDTLLLRYEWQERRTVWAEDEFDFQDEWPRERLAWHLDYWFGRRRPEVVPEDERWKCRFCAFRDACEVGRLVQSGSESSRVNG